MVDKYKIIKVWDYWQDKDTVYVLAEFDNKLKLIFKDIDYDEID